MFTVETVIIKNLYKEESLDRMDKLHNGSCYAVDGGDDSIDAKKFVSYHVAYEFKTLEDVEQYIKILEYPWFITCITDWNITPTLFIDIPKKENIPIYMSNVYELALQKLDNFTKSYRGLDEENNITIKDCVNIAKILK